MVHLHRKCLNYLDDWILEASDDRSEDEVFCGLPDTPPPTPAAAAAVTAPAAAATDPAAADTVTPLVDLKTEVEALFNELSLTTPSGPAPSPSQHFMWSPFLGSPGPLLQSTPAVSPTQGEPACLTPDPASPKGAARLIDF